MACDVGVTRVEMADLDRAQLIVAIAALVRGAHHAVLEIGVRDLILARADAPAHRDPGLMHGLGVARNERVPPVEIASVGQKAIGATRRQPYDSVYISGG